MESHLKCGISLGKTTVLALAASNGTSLRTTVPMSVVKQFDLKPGDKLDWLFQVKDNNLVMIVRPIKISQ